MVCRSAVWRCSPAAIFRPIPASMLRSGRCCASMIVCRRRCLIRSALPKPIRRARSPDRSASTLIIQSGRPAWSQKTGALRSTGLVADKSPWTVDRLRSLPQQAQITRHICIEGWSQIGQWNGVPLHLFLRRVGADLRARYVAFTCFDGYSTSIDMASALHPQTILALDFEQQPLTLEWGAPVRLRIPVKLGFKSAKNLESIAVTNTYPGGFWENQGYDWFSGV